MSKPYVLIVDDEPPLRELIAVSLGDDYVCSEASDSAEALRMLRERPPSLVLLDVMLPDGSGLDVVRAMRDDPALRDVPAVIVSAWQAPEDIERAVESGADAFLPKPFPPEELVDVVNRLVGDAR
ncbi:MAG TPA: response regulator [Gaiellaceae bacterium]